MELMSVQVSNGSLNDQMYNLDAMEFCAIWTSVGAQRMNPNDEPY